MYEAVQKCKHCGANLTLDDMRKTNCPYCGTVYPHHSQAAQHAQVAGQVMNQMMAQQAQIQNQWRGAFGVGPMPPPPGAFGSPYGDPNLMAQAQFAHVNQISRRITLIVTLSIAFVFLLVGVIVVANFLL
jgi:predicted RNA-binding Zn-ribbon protein involved in translation (DUF1610 family)